MNVVNERICEKTAQDKFRNTIQALTDLQYEKRNFWPQKTAVLLNSGTKKIEL